MHFCHCAASWTPQAERMAPQQRATKFQHALSRLIDVINERFGTDFNEADQLLFDQIVEAAMRVDSLQQAAQANAIDKFQLVFRQVLESLFIERMDMNEDLFARFMNEPEFQEVIAKGLGQKAYERLSKTLFSFIR
jgi:type I restriction enzyme, R subunit